MLQTVLRAAEFGGNASSSIIERGASAGTLGTIASLVLAEPAAIIGGAVGAAYGASEDVTSGVAAAVGQTIARTEEFGNWTAASVIECGASAGTVGTLAGLVLAEPAAIIGGVVGAAFGASEDASYAVESTVGQTVSRAGEFGNSAAASVIDRGGSAGTIGTLASLVLAEPAALIGGAVGAAYGASEDVALTVENAYIASEHMTSTMASTVGEAVSTTAEFGSNVASLMMERVTAASTIWAIGVLVLAVPIAIIGGAANAIYGVRKTETVDAIASAIIKCARAAFAYSTMHAHLDDADNDDVEDENAERARGFELAWKTAWFLV